MVHKIIILVTLLICSNITWFFAHLNIKKSYELILQETIVSTIKEQRSIYENIIKESCAIKDFNHDELDNWLQSNDGFREQ